jgi:hypothetical protein
MLPGQPSSKGKFAHFIKHELREMIPPLVFFLFAFHFIVLLRSLMLMEYGVRISAISNATISALIVAKVILIADVLPFINRFPGRPLIYNVAWKTLICFVVALLVHYLEHLVPLWWSMGSLSSANKHILEKTIWPHFWAIQLCLFVLFAVFCAVRELSTALGKGRIFSMFFLDGSAATRDGRADSQTPAA